MRAELFYIEGEHDEVPGIVRELAVDEKDARAKTEDLVKAGARVYRQEIAVDLPEAYRHLEM
ncbi:hypothetical protein EN847_34700, partial [Mesorhizobium sp. M1C.F.Ca.ET.204.01.1.1]|uniref:hypothetical protein n=1 Tax=Mesorhizobium sp. M1C.F.Ca.ET.204.01.1.1 TaxID=2563929 RepID=UPI00109353E3